jgi:2-hydroxy-6-oxonona-2,4-dienedioate hydrolase
MAPATLIAKRISMTPNDPLAELLSSGLTPEAITAEIASDAEVVKTPCGDGDLVWRRWGKGRPLVLVHGGSGSWTHWIKQIPAFKRDYEVWAVDMPGLGDSDMPPVPQIPATSGTMLALGLKSLIPREARAHVVAFSTSPSPALPRLACLKDRGRRCPARWKA